MDAIGLSAVVESRSPALGNDDGLGCQVFVGKTLEIERQRVVRVFLQKSFAQSQEIVVGFSEALCLLNDVLVGAALGKGCRTGIIVQSQIGGGKEKLIPGGNGEHSISHRAVRIFFDELFEDLHGPGMIQTVKGLLTFSDLPVQSAWILPPQQGSHRQKNGEENDPISHQSAAE